MSESVIGMFGLGNFGSPIAGRLAQSFPVLAYDPDVEDSPAGVDRATDAGQIAAVAEIVVLCLPSPTISLAVVSSIVETPDSVTRLIIELSTTGLAGAAHNAGLATGAGVGYVDAPVSGTRPKAAAGELTVMASGAPVDVGRARPVLEAIANNVFVLGERPGLGQAMKLVNNIINATAFAVTSEAIVVGARIGLDMAQMVEILNVSTGRTSSSADKFPVSVLPRTFSFGARGEIVHKDTALFLDAAATVGLHPSVASASEALWGDHVTAHPDIDFTNLFRYVEDDEGGVG